MKTRTTFVALALIGLSMLAGSVHASRTAATLAASAPGITTRASVASDGTEANQFSWNTSISADGRFVAFASLASNLVPGDTYGGFDIFLHDLELDITERVSIANDGSQAYGESGFNAGPSVSADGRYVAFESVATNLVPEDTRDNDDIFVRDREAGTTELISVSTSGIGGDGYSDSPSLSADGRYVAFQSYASDLVTGDTNGALDVFVRDREAGTTERVSVASDGGQGNGISGIGSISADGRYVVFTSHASNLVAGDTNECGMLILGHCPDAFVHDRQTGTTERISVDSAGIQANDSSWGFGISADGRYVAFTSKANNLVPGDTNMCGYTVPGPCPDVFVHDRQTGVTERVSVDSAGNQADDLSMGGGISADGRYVSFHSTATNLVPGDTNGWYDVFVHDRQTGATNRVSVAFNGTEGNADSTGFSLSADGRSVAFMSDANNLVAGDTNNTADIFVREPGFPSFLPLVTAQ